MTGSDAQILRLARWSAVANDPATKGQDSHADGLCAVQLAASDRYDAGGVSDCRGRGVHHVLELSSLHPLFDLSKGWMMLLSAGLAALVVSLAVFPT